MAVAAPLSIAVVGCGAVAEQLHLPALTAAPQWRVATLVDPNRLRAEELAGRHGVPHVAESHHHLGDVKAAIVAAPNHLHSAITIDLLRAGIDVFVEKPAATTSQSCAEMAAVAAQQQRVLAVGMVLRFSPTFLAVKTMLESGLLGRLRSVDVRSGVDFAWPLASDYLLDPRAAGGGVLMDLGVHVLDLLVGWFGDLSVEGYRDDSFGGVEADCELHFRALDDVVGVVELSRTRDLRQSVIISGDRLAIEVGLASNTFRILTDGPTITGGVEVDGVVRAFELGDLVAQELVDFHAAVTDRRPPAVSAAEAQRSLAVIEAAYGRREPLELPWLSVSNSPGN